MEDWAEMTVSCWRPAGKVAEFEGGAVFAGDVLRFFLRPNARLGAPQNSGHRRALLRPLRALGVGPGATGDHGAQQFRRHAGAIR